MEYFEYSDIEIEYLKSRDPVLKQVIEQIGIIKRAVIPDLFAALVNSIVGQQISTKAHQTIWTAEMILTFSLQRKDIISYSDLAILRGMRMVYHHRRITPQLFTKYKRRYGPYATIASLYLWAVAAGAIPELKDYAPKSKNNVRI